MVKDGPRLPVVQSDLDEGAPSCSPKIYISNEEAALLTAMRRLHERSAELKKEMRGAEPGRLSSIESEIEALRTEWKGLASRREQAFIRKMIMLGHLPPDHLSE